MKEKKSRKRFVIAMVLGALMALVMIALRFTYGGRAMNTSAYGTLTVTSSAFANGKSIPIQHTGRGEDVSPELQLSDLSESAVTIAIIMDDLDHPPLIGNFNHWVIWNIPAQNVIPQGIPYGETVESLGNAVQGIAFGKHRYRGPKPPFGSHRYQFHVYVLDCELDLGSNSGKKDLLKSMEGHVVQYGFLMGKFK